MGGTLGSGTVSSADDVLRMRGVGGVFEMCMGLGSGRRGRRGLGFTNPVGTRGVLDVCLCCGGVGGRSSYLFIVIGGYLRI